MKKSTHVKLLLGMAVGSLMSMQALPAEATPGAGVGVFGGEATVAPLCAPVVCTLTPLDGRTGGWTLNAPAGLVNVGVGVAVQADTATPVAAPNLQLTITGRLGGVAGTSLGVGAWCGLSGGWDGVGTTTVGNLPLGNITTNVDNVGWIASAATLIVATNAVALEGPNSTLSVQGTDSPNTNDALVVSVVTALPVGGTGNCTTGQSTFQVVGAAAVVDPS